MTTPSGEASAAAPRRESRLQLTQKAPTMIEATTQEQDQTLAQADAPVVTA
jgi:hypothetical protein